MKNRRLYSIWSNMKNRCYNKNDIAHYKYYGARSIGVCYEWRTNYKAFEEWALHNGYSDDLSIDRINNDGWYTPYNCRWVTKLEQNNNRPNICRYLVYNGRKQTIAQWSRELGINYWTLISRINNEWDVERALTT